MRFINIKNEMNYSLFCDHVRGKKLFLYGDFDAVAQTFARYLFDKEAASIIVDSVGGEKTFMGINLLAMEDLTREILKDAVVLISGKLVSKIVRCLNKLHVALVFTADEINGSVSDYFKYEDKINQVGALLADERSKFVFDSVFDKRMDGIGEYDDIAEPDQYFNDIFAGVMTETETYLDLGTYDLGTVSSFVTYTRNKYKKIYAFEPTPVNYRYIKQALSQNPKIEVFPHAISNANDNVSFYTAPQLEFSSGNSMFYADDPNEDNYAAVETIAIDSFFDEEITFIKMDIEGAEKVALMGAEQTIKKYKPKLAISVYHMPFDILEIPLFIHALVPEYKFYMRHHSQYVWETILYAYI